LICGGKAPICGHLALVYGTLIDDLEIGVAVLELLNLMKKRLFSLDDSLLDLFKFFPVSIFCRRKPVLVLLIQKVNRLFEFDDT